MSSTVVYGSTDRTLYFRNVLEHALHVEAEKKCFNGTGGVLGGDILHNDDSSLLAGIVTTRDCISRYLSRLC
jgi:hypothetical protein